MYEFSSISVSSYDAASLADKLTEKSGEGWDVVSIVPAGTNVTAYLKRATFGGETNYGADSADDNAPADTAPAGDTYAATAIAVDESASTGVTEPEGWASAPEETAAAAGAAAWSADTGTTEVAPEPEPEPVVVAAAAEPAPAASVAAAPAGWYADPSSRYELRYWDGTQWTEHVSRSGQQFTDPPVA